MLDVHAIINLTEPARCHADRMARLELRDALHRLLRSFDDRHGIPLAECTPAMEMHHGILRLLRGYEELHGFDTVVPRPVRGRTKAQTREAA